MKKNDSYEEKNDSWLHHFAFLIPLFIILGIVICFGFVEPDYLEEGEVSITFFKPLKPMENASQPMSSDWGLKFHIMMKKDIG